MQMFQLVGSEKKRDFRALLSRLRLGPQGLKITVIVLFSFCWLLVALARSNVPRHTTTLESSSLIGLATSLKQGSVSGRDFQSIFGPGAQFLARAATSVTRTGAPIGAYGMIAFLFCLLSAVLIAVMLLVCDRLSWQDCALTYALCFLLNLFFDVFDFRTALLLLIATFAYRTIAAETMRLQIVWASGTGLLSFFAQLITIDLGIYAVLTVIGALIAGSILTRNAWVLLGIEVFVATIAAANIALVLYFKLTSVDYGLMLDYQNYAFEILRGYHNSMGTLWQLPSKQTIVLVLLACYVSFRCIMLSRDSDSLDASLFASLTIAAVLWLKSAFVSSDIPHIAGAFTPMIVVLGLLATNEWQSRVGLSAWVLAVCGLLFAWPSFNFKAPSDILQVLRREVSVRAAMKNLYAPHKPLEAGLVPSWTTADLSDRTGVPVLAFPYENHIAAGVRHPFFTPVLESYAASTESLQRYYIQALETRRREALDVIYGTDAELVPHDAGVQAITRTPQIFEYLYDNFELVNSEDHSDGHYKIRERHQPRQITHEELRFSIPSQLVDSGTLKLSAPSTCGLVRLQMRIDYTKNLWIYRPSGIEMTLKNADQVVWKGSVRPVEPNQTFVTYISPLPSQKFPKVFGDDPIQSDKWDTMEYRNLPADALGSAARRIHIDVMHCVDPQKFVAN
jgi:hypothetical protein